MRLGLIAGIFTTMAAGIALATGPVAVRVPHGLGTAFNSKPSERWITMAANDWAAGGCDSVSRLNDIAGKSDTELDRMFGTPTRKEDFRLGDRQDEFHITLQNHYPLKVAANAAIALQEWTWEKDKCRLTVWLHKPAANWVVLENIRYPAGAEF